MADLWLMVGAGLAAALSLFILSCRIGIARVNAYAVYFDIAVTLLLMVIFAGTFSGMIAAVVGGLAYSLLLRIARYFYGIEYMTWAGGPFWKKEL